VQNAVVLLDRDEQMLSRLAEFDLAAAERAHDRLMAAEHVGEIAELGRTYQRLARSLRQTLALKARLKRERAQVEVKRRPEDDPRVAARKAEVRAALTRLVWNEHEREEAEAYLQDCEGHIDLAAEEDRFLSRPHPHPCRPPLPPPRDPALQPRGRQRP
jgi:hypothetical protein